MYIFYLHKIIIFIKTKVVVSHENRLFPLFSIRHLQNFNAGMFAGACGAILVVPCDRIKCLLQVKKKWAVYKCMELTAPVIT